MFWPIMIGSILLFLAWCSAHGAPVPSHYWKWGDTCPPGAPWSRRLCTLLIILASFLMNRRTSYMYFFLTRYLLFPNPVTHIFVNFAAYVHILISKQSFLPPSFTLSLTTTTHFTMSMSMTWMNMGISAKPSSTHPTFLQCVRIARNAERCTS